MLLQKWRANFPFAAPSTLGCFCVDTQYFKGGVHLKVLGSIYTVWKYEKFTLTQMIFREINSLVSSFVKTLRSRNFCQKNVRVNFRTLHTVSYGSSHPPHPLVRSKQIHIFITPRARRIDHFGQTN